MGRRLNKGSVWAGLGSKDAGRIKTSIYPPIHGVYRPDPKPVGSSRETPGDLKA